MPTHPCLYCGDTKRPRTAEHVLQRGFGANMTLPDDVCGECNTTVFSPLDSHLLRLVRNLVYWDHPDVGPKRMIIQDRGLLLDEETGLWVSIRLDESAKPIVFPQYIFQSEGAVALFLDATTHATSLELAGQMQEELAKPGDLSITKQIVTEDLGEELPALQPAVVSGALT